MKFSFNWIEWHDPYNWATIETEDSELLEADGIENIKNAYPNTIGTVTAQDPTDNWVEVSYQYEFELGNVLKLRPKLNEILENLVCPEVFSIVNQETREIIFTEEDLQKD